MIPVPTHSAVPTSSHRFSVRLGRHQLLCTTRQLPNPSQRPNLLALAFYSKNDLVEKEFGWFGRDVGTDFRLSTTNQQLNPVPTSAKTVGLSQPRGRDQ